MDWTKKKVIMAILFSLIMIISVIVLVYIIIDETFLFETIKTLFIKPLLKLGFWAAFVFLFLMVIQSLIAPIPSELILLSGAMIFGFWWGTVLGLIGSMLSAWITFYIANQGGRTILEATGEKLGFVDKMVLVLDDWIENWGLWAIIVGRAVPVIMFDPVSYAAGVSNIKLKHYMIATFIGSIPRALFYAWLGIQTLNDNPPEYILEMTDAEVSLAAGRFNTIFFIIFGVLILMLFVANILGNKKNKKNIDKIENLEQSETS
jgi:uncharacterized membrane protein YdjX (TVP38/TMEM64 family)